MIECAEHVAPVPDAVTDSRSGLAARDPVAVMTDRRLFQRDIVLPGDSTPVVTQATGTARCRAAALQAHRTRFAELALGFDRVRIRHIGRDIGRAQNLAGIALARLHPRQGAGGVPLARGSAN